MKYLTIFLLLIVVNLYGQFTYDILNKTEQTYKDFYLLKSRHGGAKADAQTEFKVASDKDNFYIGIKCFDPNMDKLQASVKDGEVNPWRDDIVEIFLSPENVPMNYYQFAVSANGARYQMYFEEKGLTKPDFYMPIYEAKITKKDNYWLAELKIPVQAFYMTNSKDWKNSWLINVARVRKFDQQFSSWAKLNTYFSETENFKSIDNIQLKKENYVIKSAKFNAQTPTSGVLEVTLDVENAGIFDLNNHKYNLVKGENKVDIKDLTFPASGKNNYLLTLKKDGKVVSERYYPVSVNFVPIKVEFTSPSYKKCFFAEQNSTNLQGRVFSASPVEIVIKDKSYYTQTDGTFDIDIAHLNKSNFEVTFKTQSYSINEKIRFLKPLQKGMSYIENKQIFLEGKPIFALSWYGSNKWCVSQRLIEKYPKQSDKHAINFQELVNLQPSRLIKGIEGREATKDVKPSADVFAAIKAKIEENRNTDFKFYYLADEPECRGVSPIYLKYLYDYISELDPYRPVLIISRAPLSYKEAADIISPHPYLSPSIDDYGVRKLRTSVADIVTMCRSFANEQRENQVLGLTPQIFSYRFINRMADYPTFDELNASVFAMVCLGGKFYHPFVWNSHFERIDLDLGSDYIYNTLNSIAPLLDQDTYEVTIDNENVLAIANKSLLIATNYTPQEQSVTIKFNDKTKTYKLNPYEVIIETTAVKLPSLSKLKEDIAQAQKVTSERGNILLNQGNNIELSFPPSKPYDLINAMSQEKLMFDGNINSASWLPRNLSVQPFYELAFTKFVPKFSKIVVHGYGIESMVLKIWKYGEWLTPKATKKDGKYFVELDFGQQLSTVKIRLEFAKSKKLELYEIELIK